MTKETKIGLLVGLAFIIVIGILLSDHIQSSTEPPRAAIGNAGYTARRATETPGAGANPVVDAAPVTPIATSEEIRNRPVVQNVIKVGPAQGNGAALDDSKVVINKVSDPAPPLYVANGPSVTETPLPAGSALASAQAGASVPQVDPGFANLVTPVGPAVTPVSVVSPVKVVAMKSYVAAKGDSLSKIAAKFYGDKSPAMIKLIVDANKDLKADPKNLMAGKTYLIPANPKGNAPTLLARTGPTTAPSVRTAVVTAPAATAAKTSTVMYTVKAGDNLWKIATEEVGSGNAVSQIRELNKDVLKGDALKVNMKLKLPAKAVATAD